MKYTLRPILIPTKHTQKVSEKSVEPFWNTAAKNTVTRDFYIRITYQCWFRRNRSTNDHIFSIRQILEKKWEYNNEVCQLFIDFEKAYESLYAILIKFGVPKS